MNSIADIKTFLTEQNLFNLYISGENTQVFESLTTPEGIDNQTSFSSLVYDARFWISYNQYADDFTLCIAYFTHSGNPISRETFAEGLPTSPYGRYDETNERKWVKDGTLYRLQPLAGAVVLLPIKTILPR